MVSSESVVKLFVISKKNLALFLGLFLISWIIAGFLWWQFEIDKAILFVLNNANYSDGFAKFNRLVTNYGMPVIVFIYLIYLVASFKYDSLKEGKELFLLIIISFAAAGVAGDLLKEVFNRVRPLYEFPNQLTFLTDSQSPSFPSGHGTKAFAFVLPFLFYARYKGAVHKVVKVLLTVIATWICFSRITLGAHYLSDVLAGFGMACLMLPIAVVITNRIIGRITREKLDTQQIKWIVIYIGLIILLLYI